MRRPSRPRRPTIALAVFALAVGALLLQDGSLPHLHDRPGVFNHDHDLSLLATRGGGAPLPDGAPPISFLPDIAAEPGRVLARPAASPLRYSAPRAPPLAG
jgi:hypothetical protein